VETQSEHPLIRWAFLSGALASIVAVYRVWLHVNPTTVALTLLLFILLLAARWGLRYAVAASMAATACYNYFFLPPVGTFTIADPQNWLGLLAFLVTAVIGSRLSARIREEAYQASTRQREVEMLFHLSRELLQTDKVASLVEVIPGSVARVSGAGAVLLYLGEGAEEGGRHYEEGDPVSPWPGSPRLRELLLQPALAWLAGDSQIAVPLRVGVKPRGVLLAEGLSLSNQTLEALGGLVSIAIDRAQALEDVTRSEAAKESERLRTVMLDSITHELRTPLTSIKAAVTTLLSAGALSGGPMSVEDTRELLTVVDEESDRLNHLVAQAVEMAQLDTREVQMHPSPQRVEDLLDGLVEENSAWLAERAIWVEIPADLPLVVADPEWMRKVLLNLLENAAKYSARDPIEVRAEPSGKMVWISVMDRGIGIDSREQSLIFDKFYRGRSQVQRAPGTGMGLAICRAILRAHGGTIWVRSQPGRGSTFTFSLPVSERAGTEARPWA
jgi:two-component system sensor histidine kinase KdpD